ncbi:MAG: hypothetical protein HY080_12300 [Gammaproteobacteria bacterium]|nr:hypothetical protein [Gammaproteobacteria bacterium]
MTFDTTIIAERIKEVAIRENKLTESLAHDVAFHMTDWLEELARYSEFCQHPHKLTNKQVEELLLAFLTHVPNHVAAASKLYTDIPVTDVFGVGATAENGGK